MTMADMANLADLRPRSIRLENADPGLLPAPHVIEATRNAVGVQRYNSALPLHGLPELRKAISDRYYSDLGLRYDPENEIVVTSGATEAMLDAVLTLVNPGDKVLLTNPTYSGMAQRVRLAGGIQEFTNLEEEKDWHLNETDLRRRAKGSKMIFYMSPSMPTGTVFTEDETEIIADLAEENDAVILFNASFDKVVFDGREVINPATLPRMRERTIIAGSVSKNYNMLAWRIGWVLGPRELIKPIENVHIFNGGWVSGYSQAGATVALSGPQDWVKKGVEIYQKRRDTLLDALKGSSGLVPVRPEGGYYFIANITRLGVKSPEFCEKLLQQENVATTPMVAWGSDDFGYDHVRFIFSKEPETKLKEAGKLIKHFVQENYAKKAVQ